jgi:hypothetical protein
MGFCTLEMHHCHYTISGYHTNKLLSVNTLRECKLHTSQMSKQSSVSVYRVCSESTDNMLMWICEYNILYTENGSGVTVIFVENGVKHRPRCIIWQHETGKRYGRKQWTLVL